MVRQLGSSVVTSFEIAVVDGSGTPAENASTAIVPWWSLTKTLIAACALRLAERGRLDLDTPMSGLPYTLRHLLLHRAGVGDYGGRPDYRAAVAAGEPPWPEDELLRLVPPTRLLFPPGTGFSYSNVGYLLARRAVERACGAGLERALVDLVLRPLGLASSRLAEGPDDMLSTAFAGGHGTHPGWVYHGTVVGPVVEAALALHRLLTGDLLAPASRAAMVDVHPAGEPPAGRLWTTTGYGLGLMIGTLERPGVAAPVRVLGHSAAGPGSVGAVYRARDGVEPRTVAVFASGMAEDAVEDEALRRLTAG